MLGRTRFRFRARSRGTFFIGFLLLEDNAFILLEDGFKIELEDL